MINRNAYKSLLESVQEAVAPIEETEEQVDSVEQWDEIDEILAEGLELYGEEGFTTILTHFAETDEMSEELSDLLQLDEAGYKRLMRLRKAAYEAGQKGSPSHGKKMRAAADREAQVAAAMARRGGASQEAVKGGGSFYGKSGKATKKAWAQSQQRRKAIDMFNASAGYKKAQGKSRSSTEKKISRKVQQFRDDLRNRSRSGDLG